MSRYTPGPVVSDRRTWIAIGASMVALVVFLVIGLMVAPALASLIAGTGAFARRAALMGLPFVVFAFVLLAFFFALAMRGASHALKFRGKAKRIRLKYRPKRRAPDLSPTLGTITPQPEPSSPPPRGTPISHTARCEPPAEGTHPPSQEP